MYHTYHLAPSVRLCFGSGTASEGIAASNTRNGSGSMLEWQNRTFITGAGKKAEFYPEHLTFQGGNGKATLSDEKAVAFTGMDKLEITAHGTIRLAATNIYGQVPLEINMYRARAYCEAKGKYITARVTKRNPPTVVGGADMGFTFNNEFDATAQRSVICSSRFIRYKPFQDDPEETVNLYETTLNGAAVAANVLAGLTVVGIIAVGAVYVAGAAATAGVAIACAPYVVGTLTVLCGGAAVLGQGIKDIKKDEVSSTGAYLVKGAGSALIGAVAGMAFCMAPAVAARDAARIVARKSAASAAEAAAVNSTRILKTAMIKRVGGNALSIAFLVNNAVADIRGENPIEDAVGEKAYDFVQNMMFFYSAETFFIGLSMWKASAINMVEGGSGFLPQGISQEQFDEASKLLRDSVGDISDDIVVQGSRASGTAKPTSDIDIAIRVSPEEFDGLINQYFKTPNPGSAKERTMLHAIETGKIQAGEAKLSGLRKQLEEIFGIDVDISIIREGGIFDNPPFIPFK